MVLGNDFTLTTESNGAGDLGEWENALRTRCSGLLIRLNLDSVTCLYMKYCYSR